MSAGVAKEKANVVSVVAVFPFAGAVLGVGELVALETFAGAVFAFGLVGVVVWHAMDKPSSATTTKNFVSLLVIS